MSTQSTDANKSTRNAISVGLRVLSPLAVHAERIS